MSSGVDISTHEFTASLALLLAEARVAGEADVNELGEAMAADAAARAPVATGELRDSIHTVKTEGGVDVVVGSDHAIPVEYGTSAAPAQPFLRPAREKAAGHVSGEGTPRLRATLAR